ncbi:MAG: YceD family protein [Janthinobacterium lividum]
MTKPLPYSEPLRLHQIGAGLNRTLEPTAEERARIAKSLDLVSLDSFTTELTVTPTVSGWRIDGRVKAELVQACGLTLEPVPDSINQTFLVNLTEQPYEPETDENGEIDLELEDDFPDVVEDGRIDLGQYAVEQLALTLNPFPRKEGAVFEQPPEPVELSPFAVLKSLKDDSKG